MKTFTTKQVLILTICIVAAIAFIETSEPILSLDFLRQFGLKLLGYGLISEFVVILLGSSKNFSD